MNEDLVDNREFVATLKQWRVLTEVLDRPARVIPELARLFSERKIQEFTTENIEGTEEGRAGYH